MRPVGAGPDITQCGPDRPEVRCKRSSRAERMGIGGVGPTAIGTTGRPRRRLHNLADGAVQYRGTDDGGQGWSCRVVEETIGLANGAFSMSVIR